MSMDANDEKILTMVILILVILMLILKVLHLNKNYADTDYDLCIGMNPNNETDLTTSTLNVVLAKYFLLCTICVYFSLTILFIRETYVL